MTLNDLKRQNKGFLMNF